VCWVVVTGGPFKLKTAPFTTKYYFIVNGLHLL